MQRLITQRFKASRSEGLDKHHNHLILSIIILRALLTGETKGVVRKKLSEGIYVVTRIAWDREKTRNRFWVVHNSFKSSQSAMKDTTSADLYCFHRLRGATNWGKWDGAAA